MNTLQTPVPQAELITLAGSSGRTSVRKVITSAYQRHGATIQPGDSHFKPSFAGSICIWIDLQLCMMPQEWCCKQCNTPGKTSHGLCTFLCSSCCCLPFKHITTWPYFYSLENILFVHFLFDIYNSLILTSNVLNVYLSVILSYRSNKPETRQIQGA